MKIAILGYGKMGREIEQIALQRKHDVVLKADIHTSRDDINTSLQNADAAIEFSTPSSAVENIYACFNSGIPVVVGTTGWYERFDEVKKNCTDKKQALFHATNFSIGVNLFFRINEYLAGIMNNHPAYDVSMEEIHHIHKLDSPSGTGISLAEQILSRIPRKKKWKEGNSASPDELLIHSRREGEVPGTHTIRYASPVDDIVISHIAHNRKGFATGAVLAAEWLKGKTGMFTMKDMLK